MATGSITRVNFSSITGRPFTSVGLKELVYHLETQQPLDKCYNFAGMNGGECSNGPALAGLTAGLPHDDWSIR